MATADQRRTALETAAADDRGPRRTAALMYLFVFAGWILLAAPVVYVLRDNRFVRFHAIQALQLALLGVVFQALSAVVLLEGLEPLLDVPAWLFLVPLLALFLVPVWVWASYGYRAYRGEAAWFPVVGTVAERVA